MYVTYVFMYVTMYNHTYACEVIYNKDTRHYVYYLDLLISIVHYTNISSKLNCTVQWDKKTPGGMTCTMG